MHPSGADPEAAPETYIVPHTLRQKSIRTICSVWSKMGSFQLSLVDTIHAATLLLTTYVWNINETFQMRYYMKFYLKGHQKYKQSNFWLFKFA